ncbi:siroheme synthase [Peptoniphilus sp. MSJ-1]|uniref:precorrin-2 dehydrogenase n=1 Tax=Peptoniphilus ovalis TaxID=2841503 RepID=A0ABS6FIR6_9FIRM|nr:NAD(P)-dependent oxidoreductase [Peptoniphilus ovalis]MBU5669105.1 siroheme synthase [Peptoniphilus ovalis]
MRYLPVAIDTSDKKILILGGGFLALTALKSVIDTEAEIYMIAERFTKDIVEKSEKSQGKIKLKEYPITKDFVFMGYDYVLIATEDFEINETLESRANQRNTLYERFDIFSKSSMSINKSIERGPITFSINSSRINPAITNIIYEDLKKFAENYNLEKLNILTEIRSELVRKNSKNIDDIIKKLYESETINLSTFLDTMPEYKIEDLKSSENLLNHIENGESLKIEREENIAPEKIIDKNIKEAKETSNKPLKENELKENNSKINKINENNLKNNGINNDDEVEK